MSSIENRIALSADLRDMRVEQFKRQDLLELRAILEDLAEQTYHRVRRVTHTRDKEVNAAWLHNKTYERTFDDHGNKSKRVRTVMRFGPLLRFCGGDKRLLEAEYDRAISKFFHIKSDRYAWGIKLMPAPDGDITIMHRWRLAKKA